ncbi:hypothetical protein EDF53_0811 [Curtobacterium sp. PhB78]|nr:hypothetical protein EDF53_0811 [Curtobacterium sp. PhB78]
MDACHKRVTAAAVDLYAVYKTPIDGKLEDASVSRNIHA